MKNKTPLEEIVSCLQEQQKCYDALLEKLEDQKKAIGLADETRLLAIIAEKDVLIGTTRKLEEKVAATFKGVPEAGRNNILKATAQSRDRIDTVLKKLIALENACEETLNKEKTRIHEQIKELQQKNSVLKRYGKPGEGTSWFSKKA